MVDLSFFSGKRIFVTGHTGFKGSWLCRILVTAGAIVTGYSLEPPTDPNLFSLCGFAGSVNSVIADIRDRDKLFDVFRQTSPELVIHMAAQPLVRESYKYPVYTYETNVIGTVNILECLRVCEGVGSFLNVTTDKVYLNNEWHRGYRETDQLDGFDPYSNSKSCSELVTNSYRNAFFSNGEIAISTARAGNVIGGGDFAVDRIIPDCVRAASKNEAVVVRNPHSVRPYQHVLESLFAYLLIIQRQYEDDRLSGCYNVGPDDCSCVSTGTLADLFCKAWGNGLSWENRFSGGPHEAGFLKLDCSRMKSVFNWAPKWSVETAVQKTVDWTRVYFEGLDVSEVMDAQIEEFLTEEQ